MRNLAVASRSHVSYREDMRMRDRALEPVDLDKAVRIEREPALARPIGRRTAERGNHEVERLERLRSCDQLTRGIDSDVIFLNQ